MEVLGWASTLLIILGFYLNARSQRNAAFITWIVGDIGWIIYDIHIVNWSHLSLSVFIIFLNLYGIYNNFKHDNQGISTTHK